MGSIQALGRFCDEAYVVVSGVLGCSTPVISSAVMASSWLAGGMFGGECYFGRGGQFYMQMGQMAAENQKQSFSSYVKSSSA